MHVYVGFNAVYSDRELWLLYDMEIKKEGITCRCQTETVVVGLLVFFVQSSLDKLRCRALKGNNDNKNDEEKKRAHDDNAIKVKLTVVSTLRGGRVDGWM